ncbi:MAG: hypothetical protein Q4C66_05850 [Lachnospiraceae bacterium]|nr:hypothetical protein [Lachnospiraceae bacterium]
MTKHKAEVRKMILSEYDEELHLKDTYHCGYEDGRSEGESLFASLTAKLIGDSRLDDLTNALKDEEFRRCLYREYGIKKE